MPRTTAKRHSPGPLGSVRRLPSGRYQAYYRHLGDTFTAPHTFPSLEAARGWLATERAERAAGNWRDPRVSQITLEDYARGWLDSRTNLAARTRGLYRRLLDQRVLPAAGDLERGRLALGRLAVVALTPALVRTWFAKMSADCARDATSGPDRRPWSRGSTHGPHPARAWAEANGHPIATRGRLPAAILEAWQLAGAPTPGQRPTRTGKTTAAQSYRLLHAVLGTAVLEGLIPTNPALVKGAGIVDHAERGTATGEEISRLAAAMPEHLAAAVWIAAWSGLRQGELLALARRHVDLSAGSLRVERALGRDRAFHRPKTRASVRTVYLPAFVVDRLADHLARFTAEDDPEALVFTSRAGTPVYAGHLHACFARARSAIGRPDLTWHDLRHTGATLAYQAGGSVRDVQRRLGHATSRAAMIYAHAADDSDRHLAARLDAMFGGSSDPAPRPPLYLVTHSPERTAS
jgi:integrase